MPEHTGNSSTRPSAAASQPRTFSNAVTSALHQAATQFAKDPLEADESLRNAVLDAASEAHAGGWKADELVPALRLATRLEGLPPRELEALETTVRRRGLIAFFGAQDAVF